MQRKRSLFLPADLDINYLGGIPGVAMDFEIRSKNCTRSHPEQQETTYALSFQGKLESMLIKLQTTDLYKLCSKL
jgi:hypothetical protein